MNLSHSRKTLIRNQTIHVDTCFMSNLILKGCAGHALLVEKMRAAGEIILLLITVFLGNLLVTSPRVQTEFSGIVPATIPVILPPSSAPSYDPQLVSHRLFASIVGKPTKEERIMKVTQDLMILFELSHNQKITLDSSEIPWFATNNNELLNRIMDHEACRLEMSAIFN